LTRGDRKTYAGQAKAQRAKGFERIDATFVEVKRIDAQACRTHRDRPRRSAAKTIRIGAHGIPAGGPDCLSRSIVIASSGDIWLLRLQALLARARGDDTGYRDYRDRYRAMANSLGDEGHMAWAEAMP
jgi:hypothetical protein